MIVLTGGAGFIGSTFLSRLNAEGEKDVLVVDNLSTSDKWKNLVGKSYRSYMHKHEFLERFKNNTLQGTIDGIVHLGACSTTHERDVDYLMRNNYEYTCTLAEYALHNGIRFVYASSAQTYGDGSLGYDDIDDLKLATYRPMSAYGFSKHVFDLWAYRQHVLDRMAGVKFFNVYGPNEYHKGAMLSVPFKAFHQATADGKISLFKSYKKEFADGEQKRDFIYIKDCCDVLWWLFKNPNKNGLFNLGSGVARSWNELAKAVFSALNIQPKIQYIEMPDNLKGQYQYFTKAEMKKLKDAGYSKPFTSLEDGVRDYVQGYLQKDNPFI